MWNHLCQGQNQANLSPTSLRVVSGKGFMLLELFRQVRQKLPAKKVGLFWVALSKDEQANGIYGTPERLYDTLGAERKQFFLFFYFIYYISNTVVLRGPTSSLAESPPQEPIASQPLKTLKERSLMRFYQYKMQ